MDEARQREEKTKIVQNTNCGSKNLNRVRQGYCCNSSKNLLFACLVLCLSKKTKKKKKMFANRSSGGLATFCTGSSPSKTLLPFATIHSSLILEKDVILDNLGPDTRGLRFSKLRKIKFRCFFSGVPLLQGIHRKSYKPRQSSVLGSSYGWGRCRRRKGAQNRGNERTNLLWVFYCS